MRGANSGLGGLWDWLLLRYSCYSATAVVVEWLECDYDVVEFESHHGSLLGGGGE